MTWRFDSLGLFRHYPAENRSTILGPNNTVRTDSLVAECSFPKAAARVRFPVSAVFFLTFFHGSLLVLNALALDGREKCRKCSPDCLLVFFCREETQECMTSESQGGSVPLSSACQSGWRRCVKRGANPAGVQTGAKGPKLKPGQPCICRQIEVTL